jgi:hypothetical protein
MKCTLFTVSSVWFGHNVPRDAPWGFARAIVDVDGFGVYPSLSRNGTIFTFARWPLVPESDDGKRIYWYRSLIAGREQDLMSNSSCLHHCE